MSSGVHKAAIITAAIVMTLVFVRYLYSTHQYAQHTRQHAFNSQSTIEARLREDIMARYDGQEITGVQVPDIVADFYDEHIRIAVEGDSGVIFYGYKDEDLSVRSHASKGEAVKEARKTTPQSQVYVGSVKRGAGGEIWEIRFDKV